MQKVRFATAKEIRNPYNYISSRLIKGITNIHIYIKYICFWQSKIPEHGSVDVHSTLT
jgi:hypothetical protein